MFVSGHLVTNVCIAFNLYPIYYVCTPPTGLILYEIASHQFVFVREDGSEQDSFKFTFKTILGSQPAFPRHILLDYIDIAPKGWRRDLVRHPSLSCTVQDLKDERMLRKILKR